MISASLTSDELVASRREAVAWIQLRDEEYLDVDAQDESIYYPTHFVTKECAGLSSLLSIGPVVGLSTADTGRCGWSQWEAMLVGVVRQSTSAVGDIVFGNDREVRRKSDDRCRPCVSFMRFDGSSLSTIHSTFKCATYRATNASNDDSIGVVHEYILALDKTGLLVHKIESRSHTLTPTDQWVLGRAMSSLWAAPLG